LGGEPASIPDKQVNPVPKFIKYIDGNADICAIMGGKKSGDILDQYQFWPFALKLSDNVDERKKGPGRPPG
jgi:hypothetical protein